MLNFNARGGGERRVLAVAGQLATLAVAGWGCRGSAEADTAGDDTAVEAACADGELSDGGACVPEACGHGPWGGADAGGSAVYVDAAFRGGDGSEAAPLDDVQAALDLAAAQGAERVVLAAGRYLGGVVLGDDHRGLTLAGRCAALVTLDADGADAVVDITGSQRTPEVALTGLTLTGGGVNGLYVYQATVAVTDTVVADNTGIGVLGAHGDLDLTRVTISGTRSDADGAYGRGLEADTQGVIRATGCTLDHNTRQGVFVNGRGASVTIEDSSILDTQPSPDGSNGFGVYVQANGDFVGRRVVIGGNAEIGAVAYDDGTSMTLEEVEIRDTHPRSRGTWGWGMLVAAGADATLRGSTLAANTELGLLVAGEGATVSVTDSTIRDTLPSPSGSFGAGLWVEDRAVLDMVGGVIDANAGAGVVAGNTGTVATFTGTAVTGNLEPEDEDGGYGVGATAGASVTFTDARIEGNRGAGVLATLAGTRVELIDTVVSGTLPDTHDAGRGIEVTGGASLYAAGCTLVDNTRQALLAGDSGTEVELVDCTVSDTRTGADGSRGDGAMIQWGASLVARGLTITGSSEVGLMASDPGTTVTLDDAWVGETHPSPDGRFGIGLYVTLGARAVVRDSVLSANTTAGAWANRAGSSVTLVDTDIEATARGREVAIGCGGIAQLDGVVEVEGGSIDDTEGPGVYVASGGIVRLDGTTLERNAFAGLLLTGGTVEATGVTITDTGPDAELGGGIGAYVIDSWGEGTLTIADSTIGPHPYAAVWLDGPGAYRVERSDLAGSEGVAGSVAPMHGNAVYARSGVATWDGVSGLLLLDDTLHDAAIASVLLDGAAAGVAGNRWSAAPTDLVQQRCEEAAALTPDAVADVPRAEICPAGNLLTDRGLQFETLYLSEVEPEG